MISTVATHVQLLPEARTSPVGQEKMGQRGFGEKDTNYSYLPMLSAYSKNNNGKTNNQKCYKFHQGCWIKDHLPEVKRDPFTSHKQTGKKEKDFFAKELTQHKNKDSENKSANNFQGHSA